MYLETPEQFADLTAHWQDEPLTLADGHILRLLHYSAARAERGHLLVLPDWGEFAEKYSEFAEILAQQGWQVHVLEWRGQGRALASEVSEIHAHTSDLYRQFLRDLREVWQLRTPAAGQACVIFGHGLGAHLLARALLGAGLGARSPCACILSSLSATVQVAGWQNWTSIAIAQFMSIFVLDLPCQATSQGQYLSPHNALTSDALRTKAIGQMLTAHPHLLSLGSNWSLVNSSAHSFYALYSAWLRRGLSWGATIRAVWRYFRQTYQQTGLDYRILTASWWAGLRYGRSCEQRMLILANSDDPLAAGEFQRKLASSFTAAEVVEISGARHDLLQEREAIRDKAYQVILPFLEQVEPTANPSSHPQLG